MTAAKPFRLPTHRPATKPRSVPEVETLPCPGRSDGGNHELGNTRAGHTRCVGCLEPWWRLDELARPARKEES